MIVLPAYPTPSNQFTYRVKFTLVAPMATADPGPITRAAVTGKQALIDVYLAKSGDTSATKIIALGAPVSGSQSLIEVDAVNMPGTYELQWDPSDTDTVGAASLYIVDTSGVAEEMTLHLHFDLRAGLRVI